ncbi:MAG TPA: site-specific integrase [Alistipes sp.]|uniref:site-specific integrase n=1 Tax=Alistipes sp. TaxID=1872444 RepID=UPI002BE6D760|nr:site-specific integrase [Alistipes sp.]HUN14047.1 site-specific integrase [Alistipes sp.]
MCRRTTFSVVFFCKKTKVNKKGKAPVYARITTSGQATEIYTQCQVEPEHWNQRLERCVLRDAVSMQINEIIASFRANILAAYDNIIKEGKEPNCFVIKQRLEHATGSSRMFLAEFSKYCDKRQAEVGVRITQLTANKYHRLLRYLAEYTKEQYKKEDLPLDMISYEYIDGLNTFMQTAHQCKNNGAVNLLCCLKNFILYAIRNEWIEKNPFRYYKMKIDKSNVKVPLTKLELDTLIRKPMPNDRLDRIRDVFVFCCLTGLAFTDADNLRREHITTDEHGTMWIHKPREKTAVMSRVPLLPLPIDLLNKYTRDPDLQVKGKLLPVPSNQKMNAYLKEIADLCNIQKNLTTHCARHTFATLAIEYGMPIDIIAKILGHTNTNMTRRYAKISEANISREMQKLGIVMAC